MRARSNAVVAVLAAFGLAACSADGGGGPATRSADPANCPGDVLDVVVSVAQWADLVTVLAGDCATVTTVLGSAAGDPHDHEATTGDLAAFEGADLVVLNGAGYDSWAADAVDNLEPAPAVVSAAEVAEELAAQGSDAREDGDPHLWYEPGLVPEVALAVTAQLARLSPDAAEYFAHQEQAWTAALQPYRDALAALAAVAPGRTYAATEPVFDRTARAVGLSDATPDGYRSAVGNESDPAPGDIAAFEAALAEGSVDVLIYNTQTEGSIPEQVRAAAEDADVPVVEVTESATDPAGSFVTWQVAQLQALTEALGGTP